MLTEALTVDILIIKEYNFDEAVNKPYEAYV